MLVGLLVVSVLVVLGPGREAGPAWAQSCPDTTLSYTMPGAEVSTSLFVPAGTSLSAFATGSGPVDAGFTAAVQETAGVDAWQWSYPDHIIILPWNITDRQLLLPSGPDYSGRGTTVRLVVRNQSGYTGSGTVSVRFRLSSPDPNCGSSLPDANVFNLQGSRPVIGAAGHPVNTASGSFFHEQSDAPAPAGVYGLGLSRTYNSSDDLDKPVAVPGASPGRYGLFGPQWTSNVDVSVRSLDSTSNPFGTSVGVELRFGDGRRVVIPRTGSTWSPPPELFATFVWDGAASVFRLRLSTGEEWAFNAAGRLSSMDSGRGQSVRACPATGTISSLRANAGDCVATPQWQVTLTDSNSDGLVDQAAFADGSKVDYTYAVVAGLARLATVSTRYRSGETPGKWTFTYDGATGLMTQIARKVTGAGDADPHPDVVEVANHYDASRRVDYQSLESGDHVTFAYAGLAGSPPRRTTTVTYCTSWDSSTGACNAGSANEVFVYAHDDKGILLEMTDSTPSGGKQIKKAWTNEELTQFNSRRNAQSTATYDPGPGRLTQWSLPSPTTGGATSGAESFTYCGSGFTADDARPKTATNAAGEVTTYYYGANPDTDPQCQASASGGGLFASKIVDNNGQANRYTYTTGGLVASVTDADGIKTTNAWDTGRRLLLATTVGQTSGNRSTYFGYDAMGRQIVTRTGTGDETWTTYFGSGQVASQVGPVPGPARACSATAGCNFPAVPDVTGPTSASTYFLDSTLRSRTDQEGKVSDFDRRYKNGAADCAGAAPGCVRQETEKGPKFSGTDTRRMTTVRQYDAVGRLQFEKVGDPTVSGGSEVATTAYTYTQLGRPDVVTGPTGIQTKYFYDGDGNVTKTAIGAGASDGHASFSEFDLRGRVTRTAGAAGDVDETGQSARACTAYTYDQLGRVIEQDQGVFNTSGPGCVATPRTKLLRTWFHYDKAGRKDFTVLDNDGTGAAPVWNAAGALTSADVNDHVIQQTFTAAGRLKDVIEPPADAASFNFVSGTGKRTTTNAYYTNANVAAGQYPGELKTIKDPQNGAATTKLEYDNARRVTKRTEPGGLYTRSVYAFDPATKARIDKTFTPSPTGSGEAETDRRYLRNGWLASQTAPFGVGLAAATTFYGYYDNGRLAVAANPIPGLQNWVSYSYDSRGNRTARTASAKNSPTDTVHNVTETWAWNLANQQLAYKDPNNNTTTNTYYLNTDTGTGKVPGAVSTVTQPSGRVETRQYWNSSLARSSLYRVAGQSDVTVSSWWSGRGQRLRTQAPTTGAGQVNTDYTYDAAGRLTQMVSPDPLLGSLTTSWQWDVVGNQTQMNYPWQPPAGGGKAKYTHDKLNRLTGTLSWDGSLFQPVAAYTYNGNGQPTTETITGYGTRTWTYPANTLQPSRYQQVFSGVGVNTDTALTWRQDGRISRENSTASGGPDRSYTYDPAGQLTCRGQAGAACPTSVPSDCSGGSANLYLYSYDPRGYRLCQSNSGTITNSTYTPDNTGRLKTIQSGYVVVNYTYDPDGRQTGSTSPLGNTNVTFDPRGLPTAVTLSGTNQDGTENRRYDGEGRLVHTTKAGVNGFTEYTWDPTKPVPQMSGARDASGYIQSIMLYGRERISWNTNIGTVPYTYNWRGDVTKNNTAAAPADYDPFGTPYDTNGANPQPWAWYTQFTYQGELTTTDSIYLRNRTYNYNTGLFTTRDPLDGVNGTTTVTNPYTYVNNDPLNKTDPLGLRQTDPTFNSGGGVGGCPPSSAMFCRPMGLPSFGSPGANTGGLPGAAAANYAQMSKNQPCFEPLEQNNYPSVDYDEACLVLSWSMSPALSCSATWTEWFTFRWQQKFNQSISVGSINSTLMSEQNAFRVCFGATANGDVILYGVEVRQDQLGGPDDPGSMSINSLQPYKSRYAVNVGYDDGTWTNPVSMELHPVAYMPVAGEVRRGYAAIFPYQHPGHKVAHLFVSHGEFASTGNAEPYNGWVGPPEEIILSADGRYLSVGSLSVGALPA
ncbi:MAG: RHS repeat-associated core domain-containing protein [Actinobacteria bacterium]|nr:RHS repeat-associated core domain-containing protein [Actinomycetota bacterium]